MGPLGRLCTRSVVVINQPQHKWKKFPSGKLHDCSTKMLSSFFYGENICTNAQTAFLSNAKWKCTKRVSVRALKLMNSFIKSNTCQPHALLNNFNTCTKVSAEFQEKFQEKAITTRFLNIHWILFLARRELRPRAGGWRTNLLTWLSLRSLR